MRSRAGFPSGNLPASPPPPILTAEDDLSRNSAPIGSRRPDWKDKSEAGTTVKPLLPYGVGIDTHQRFIQVCVMIQERGEVRQFESEFQTTWTDLLAARSWVLSLVKRADKEADVENLRYTIESTGTYHYPVLLAWRGKPSVVNPVLAGPTRRKTDVLDARMLCHHSLVGMWPASFIPEVQGEILRILLGMRYEYGRNSTRCLNRINNHLLRFGHTFGRDYSMADPYARAAVEDMCKGKVPDGEAICPEGIPPIVRPFFTRCYDLYDQFKKGREEYHKQAMAFAREWSWPYSKGRIDGDKLMKCLLSVPGIGEVSALTWLAIVCNPMRFQNSKQVAAFCGADPSLKVSAGKVTSHVKRKGNARLHHVLKNVAAQLVRRNSEPIGKWGYNIYKRHAKGGWGKAINAVSRRLAIFLWRVHYFGDEFSYEQYQFYLVPEVKDVPVSEMGLGSRYENMLMEAGLATSQQVAVAFMTSLPQQKGVGAGCLSKVKAWLDSNKVSELKTPIATKSEKVKGSSSEAESPVEPATKSSSKKRAKSSRKSTTKSTATA